AKTAGVARRRQRSTSAWVASAACFRSRNRIAAGYNPFDDRSDLVRLLRTAADLHDVHAVKPVSRRAGSEARLSTRSNQLARPFHTLGDGGFCLGSGCKRDRDFGCGKAVRRTCPVKRFYGLFFFWRDRERIQRWSGSFLECLPERQSSSTEHIYSSREHDLSYRDQSSRTVSSCYFVIQPGAECLFGRSGEGCQSRKR